jgi:magnesium chelatase family protein
MITLLAKVYSTAVFGIDAYIVEVEVDISNGLPIFDIVGLPDVAIKESKDRVRAALKNSGFEFPVKRIVINLAPADIKKEGPNFDLPIAIGILAATSQIRSTNLRHSVITGELSLDGSVKKVKGVLPMALATKEHGKKYMILPYDNSKEAQLVNDITILPAITLKQAALLVTGSISQSHLLPNHVPKPVKPEYHEDFFDVKGQENAKRGLEIAAAGGHNVLMSGPPGTGKTMLAKRLPTILPALSLDESLEITKIYSIAGLLPDNSHLITCRPFRSPHHTISRTGLVGGGKIPQPGEITLAHLGVLYLDEMPEFRGDILNLLRQPMEDGYITISRTASSITYPAKFMLVASKNPCPCGFFGDPVRECICTYHQIRNYHQRISGPVADRIDIFIEVPRMNKEDLMNAPNGEFSKNIQIRVEKGRDIQRMRFKGMGIFCNAHMGAKETEHFCTVKGETRKLLEAAVTHFGLSARAYTRILKVARTIADLDEKDEIQTNHIAEAIQHRFGDSIYNVIP